jgi:hypothetical protein
MPDDLTILQVPVFLESVNELERLLSQSSRAFLIGAGCSKVAGLPLMIELTTAVASSTSLSADAKSILDEVTADLSGSINPTIEDFLSEIVDHLAIAKRRETKKAKLRTVPVGSKSFDEKQLENALEEIKQAIADILNQAPRDLTVHRAFAIAVHRTLKTGKSIGPLSVDYFLLNYDTLFEDSLALEQVPYTDGFSGGAVAWWNPSLFENIELEARILKLHGSVDWCAFDGEELPRRIRGTIGLPDSCSDHLMIWPASTKYRETQRDPFAQMLQVFRDSLRPPPGYQKVLTCMGYSFGDSHINIEIEKALKESGSQLTLVAFTADEHPQAQLLTWLKDASICEQIRVHSRREFRHGAKLSISRDDLPWWKFENITRLLGGER